MRLTAFVCCCLAAPAILHAHRLDEYLQAARIGVDPGRIDVGLSLTPGVEVLRDLLPLIDTNQDGAISAAEAAGYAEKVRSDLSLAVDARTLPLRLTGSRFPEVAAMQQGSGIIALRFSAEAKGFGPGVHRLRFQNSHLTNSSVYLANALVPDSPAVTIGRQERDFDQMHLEFDYTLAEADTASSGPAPSGRWIPGLTGVVLLAAGVLVAGWRSFRRRRRARGF